MCDTAVRVHAGRVLFAKNSDRDPNEAQLLEWQPRREHAPGARLRCTWIEIPQLRETCAVLLSRPYWMWGAEMGANEHGVVIGNEAVFTDQPLEDRALTGMDLLRLALERADSAERAVDQITALLAEHGQGGGCGHENRGFSYSSSFLIADPAGAFVLETAGRRVAVERVVGARSISNALTIADFARAHADGTRSRVAAAGVRRGRTEQAARRLTGPADAMALLRDHGAGRVHPKYARLNGALAGPCAHAGGLLVRTQTTASFVSELTRTGVRHFATGSAAPCTGLFKPVRVETPLDLGAEPDDRADEGSLWWRHERLQRRVLRDPARLLPLYVTERDALERQFLDEDVEPAKAFAEADRRLVDWERRVVAAGGPDCRPAAVRRLWAVRNRRAGLAL